MAVSWQRQTHFFNAAAVQLINYLETIATGDYEINLSPAAVAASTTQEVDVTFPHLKVQAYVLQSDKNVTLDVNSTGSPAPAIVLVAGVPQFYSPNEGTNLFSADVTKIYIVNGTGAVANVKINLLMLSTP